MRWNSVYFRNLIEEACLEISDLKGEQGGWSVDDQEVVIYANSGIGTCIVAAYFYNSVSSYVLTSKMMKSCGIYVVPLVSFTEQQ